MIPIAKRSASLSEMIAAGALIVGLLQNDMTALAIGLVFMSMSFGLTLMVDRFERRKK